jgi:hypothetical protein
MSIVVPNFAQIGGFLYFGGHFGFKMAAIANRNGRNMMQHVLLPSKAATYYGGYSYKGS